MADPINDIDPRDIGESGPTFLLDHTDPAGVPRPDVWRQAVADFYQLDLDASVLWSQIGPAPLMVTADNLHMGTGPDAGEVTDILIDPSGATDQTIYVTTDDGGIWGTTDGANVWLPLTDQVFSISMGAIAMDPATPNILYGGSGNLFDGGSAFTKGAGVYRSADSGQTWSITDGGYFGTIFANVGINRIVCPSPGCLLVATNQGLYRSVDSGRNFGANAPNFDDRQPVMLGKICCLLLDSATPASVVYVGVAGDSVDGTGALLANRGLFRSDNAGITFPTNLLTDATAPQLPFGSFVIAQSSFDRATATNQTLYISIQTTDASGNAAYFGLWRSDNGGTGWTGPLNSINAVAAGDGFAQTTYDLTIGVDPVDPKRVYVGFQQLWLSTDGGQNFLATAVTQNQVHWDNHAIAFSPASHRTPPPAAPAPVPPTTVYTGTDGGLARSTDGGQTWQAFNGTTGNSIAASLFRGIDIGRGANNTYTYGGCQDTGTSGHRPGDPYRQWFAGINGDGWLVAIDPTDPTIVYGFDDQYFIKTTDAGAHWALTFPAPTTMGIGLTNGPPAYARAVGLDQNGADTAHRIVYVSEGTKLYKSTNSGINFAATPLNPAQFITCIVTSSASAGLVWVGTFDGTVHKSTDYGATWDTPAINTTPNAPEARPVNHIAIDPTNVQRIAVVYGGVSGIHSRFRTRHVFLSTDGGANWADISGTDGNGPVGNVPDLTWRSVVFDTSATPTPAIVIAGDSGVLRSTDAAITGTGTSATGTATWKIYGAGLPMVCCNSLAIDNSVTPPVLRVGTYGRSCWEVTRPTGPSFASDDNLAFGVVAVGQTVTLPMYVYNVGNAPLDVTAASITSVSPFTLGATPALPVTIAPGATQAFQVTYSPLVESEAFGLLQLSTSDPANATRFLAMSASSVTTGLAQRLATNPIASVGFGSASIGSNRTITVQLFNVGTAPLNITNITLSNGSPDFSLNPAPAFPVTIAPGAESDITVQFAPSGAGPLTAEFTITSDDPHSPLKLNATGTGALASSSFFTNLLQLLGFAHP